MEEGEPVDAGFSRVMGYYSSAQLAVACLSVLVSALCGLGMPFFGYVISEFTFIIILGPEAATFAEDRNTALWQFVSLCLVMGLLGFLQKIMFAVGGENLTFRVRLELFESMVHKHVGWFDKKSRSASYLAGVLSDDVPSLNALSTEALGVLTEAFVALSVGIALAFYYEWRIAAICLGLIPFVLLGGCL